MVMRMMMVVMTMISIDTASALVYRAHGGDDHHGHEEEGLLFHVVKGEVPVGGLEQRYRHRHQAPVIAEQAAADGVLVLSYHITSHQLISEVR